MDLSSFTLVEASSEQLLVSRKRQAVSSWARGMSEAEFLRREEYLDKQEHASHGRFIPWVLVPRDNTGTLDFPCSCETFRRKALVIKPSGTVQEVIGYGIASVFTAPEYRGRGFASHMMRLLHHVLARPGLLPSFPEQWKAPPPGHSRCGDGLFSVLYSDVGQFYEKCGPAPGVPGWIIHKPISTTWHLDRITGVSQQQNAKVEWLSKDDCSKLWEEDAEYIKNHLSSPDGNITRFTFLPNDGTASYLLHRVIAEAPLLPQQSLSHFGVRVTEKDGTQAYATWTLDMELQKPPVMVITRVHASPHNFPSLMKALLTEATRIGAREIEAWNFEEALLDISANLGGHTFTRSEHLSAVAWYGEEHPEELDWIFNEKFPWC